MRVLLIAALLMQAVAPTDVRDAVWAAVQPALPFPTANDRDEPVDGSDSARWIVRRVAAEGPLVVEVLANPFNREAQATAVQDMAAIQREVVAAERRAQVEFERAIGSVRETGVPVDVRGVTLSDEGLAGDRADAESRLTVDVEVSSVERTLSVAAAVAPRIADEARGAAWVITTPARVLPESGGRTRYHAAEALLAFAAGAPSIDAGVSGRFTVRAAPRDAAAPLVLVTLRGNGTLIEDVLARGEWARMAAVRR